MNKELVNYLDSSQKKKITKAKSGISKSKKSSTKSKAKVKGRSKSMPEFSAGEPLPLTLEQATMLKNELKKNPDKMLKWAKGAFDEKIELIDLANYLNQAEIYLGNQKDGINMLKKESVLLKSSMPLPAGFTFPGYDKNYCPIDLGKYKYETLRDALGWLIFSGPNYLFPKDPYPFRWHTAANTSDFIYKANDFELGKESVEIALISDFGTDYYHSAYIAKQLKDRKFPYAVHLGDIYYAGKTDEYKNNFKKWIEPILDTTSFYTLNSNHDMMSGSENYFKYISERLSKHKNQRQVGSYFCLRFGKFQLIGIDTDYFGISRYENDMLKKWLEDRLIEGRNENMANILLSSNYPYIYDSYEPSELLDKDLRKIIIKDGLVDLWFWGDSHYCALYDRNAILPFIGSCIGHGGYPYKKIKLEEIKSQGIYPPPVKFFETKSRFWKWPNLRPDMGNNGYCILRLKNNQEIELEYIDWMSYPRCNANLKFNSNGQFVISECKVFDN